ncbi:D-glycero-beta-D-manno-heptose 1-phosphate adenylyltransferase [candidate division KSB1 bacterium]
MNRKTDSKIVERNIAVEKCANARDDGKNIVFTNGCFDILHRGHIEYLETARSFGDMLMIGLNTDASVKRLKNTGRPVNSEEDRARVLAALECVDLICLFDEDTPAELIEAVRPHMLVKGAEYNVEEIAGHKTILADGGEVRTIEMVEGKSTTSLIQKIKELPDQV